MIEVEFDEGQKIIEEYVCWCGGGLVMPWSPERRSLVVVCSRDRTHEGFVRPKHPARRRLEQAGLSQEEIEQELDDWRARKEVHRMAQQLGAEKTAALARYVGVTSLTKEQATYILTTCWPDAPAVDVAKAALTCAAYGLNPLAKHLYLVAYKKKDKQGKVIGVTWAQIMGIGATRLLASRRGRYSYIDGPRIMTPKEQEKIFGYVDSAHIVAFTRVAGSQGNSAPGYGKWLKTTTPQGTEVGNTKENMAFIRSERQALDRLFPGEMPQGLAVMDEQYLPAAEEAEVIEAEAHEVEEAEVVPLAEEEGEEEHQTGVERTHEKIARTAPRDPTSPPEEGDLGISQAAWTDFWTWANKSGLSPQKVCDGLRKGSVQEWLAADPRRTLEDAKRELEKVYPHIAQEKML